MERLTTPEHADLANELITARACVDGLKRANTKLRYEKEYWHHKATHDQSTELLNQEGLREALEAIDLAHVVVIYVDLDNFKAVNDTFGHDYGDKLLAAISRLLQASTNETDTIARLGGDEFIIIALPEPEYPAEWSMGEQYMEMLRIRIKDLVRIWTLGCPELAATNFDISIGTVPGYEGAAFDDLIREADRAMYTDKRTRYPVSERQSH